MRIYFNYSTYVPGNIMMLFNQPHKIVNNDDSVLNYVKENCLNGLDVETFKVVTKEKIENYFNTLGYRYGDVFGCVYLKSYINSIDCNIYHIILTNRDIYDLPVFCVISEKNICGTMTNKLYDGKVCTSNITGTVFDHGGYYTNIVDFDNLTIVKYLKDLNILYKKETIISFNYAEEKLTVVNKNALQNLTSTEISALNYLLMAIYNKVKCMIVNDGIEFNLMAV